MSELKMTITQLEDLLDRQRQSICDYILNNVEPHGSTENGENSLYTDLQIIEACRRANYPRDFSILKKYVK